MADIWKTEFHVTEPGDSSPSEWLKNREAALAMAKPGGKVEEVTSYLDDREVIYPVDPE